jgi:ferrous iron transport protein B
LHGHAGIPETEARLEHVILTGNPNVGKSVIFSILTGKYAAVSNYPGTTVEVSRGPAIFDDKKFLLIDTPGVNSLIPLSEDEKVTRDILLQEEPRAVIQIADSKNLRRALLLTIQLAELELPLVFVLNMYDEAQSRGITINHRRLADILGVSVVKTVATQKQGIGNLKKEALKPRLPLPRVDYGKDLEERIEKVSQILPDFIPKRGVAIMLLAGDTTLRNWLHENLSPKAIDKVEVLAREAQRKHRGSIYYEVNNRRLALIKELLEEVFEHRGPEKSTFIDTLGRLSMHPLWGIPILLLVLGFMYAFVGYLGAQVLVDFIEGVIFGKLVNPFFVKAFDAVIPWSTVKDLFIGDYGIITMALTYSIAIILPIVGTFFIAFGLLEDSGYLPRLAIMVNKIFVKMGLNGRAVLPMVLGLGCDTMATLTARVLESKKERIIVTLLLALGVPCSAQLGVILGVLGGLSLKAAVLWASIVTAVLFGVGFLASKVIPGRASDFIFEVPPLRVPQITNIAAKTLSRVEWYLKEAVPLFILGTVLLFAMDKLGVLLFLENAASPVVTGLLGLPPKATDAFIVGFLRRDYGAAGLFALAKAGLMDPIQIVVSLITITLFVPCIANLLIIIKERGPKTAIAIVSFIFPFAFLVGGLINFVLRGLGVNL